MFRESYIAVALVVGLSGILQGCVGAAVGAGAVITTATVEERGLKAAAKDTLTSLRINELWLEHSEEMFRRVGLAISEGRVLLTGQVRTQQMRLDAVRLTWRALGVREGINEIQVTEKGGVGQYLRDSWVTTRLLGTLMFDKKVISINYSVETVGGIVYLMGIAQNRDELNRVTNHARNLSYVRKVVSYVRLKDDPRPRKS